MTVAIAYNIGAYGTYLEWCLTALTSSDEIVSPFWSDGSSHNFVGNDLGGFSGWKAFAESGAAVDFVRFHPKGVDESLTDNLNTVCNTVDHLIHLYPDPQSILLCINNWYYKQYKNWWEINNIDPKLIYNNWPVDLTTKIDDAPVWVRREFLSFYLMPAWFDLVEWYHPDTWSHDRRLLITVNELLHDFENTLLRIKTTCNIKYVRPISDLLKFHYQNLKNQQHLNEDTICHRIINSVFDSLPFEWEPRSLISESWIQWQLRNLGYEIRCHRLDTFPTNNVHLKELLYAI